MLYIEQLKNDFNDLQVRTDNGIYSMMNVLDGRGFEVIAGCTGDKPGLLLYDYLDASIYTELGSTIGECIRSIEDTEILQQHSLNDDAKAWEVIQ